MYLGRVSKAGRQEKADDQTYENGQANAGQIEADDIHVGVADHQVGDQRGDAGGKQHGVDIGGQLFLFHQAVQGHAGEGGPNIEDIDAPGAEADGEDKGQVGAVVGGGAGNAVQGQANGAHQRHVQEGGGKTAHGEVIGGNFAGLGDNLAQAAEHIGPVGHTERSHQEAQGQKAEYQLQEIAFTHVFDLFHKVPLS